MCVSRRFTPTMWFETLLVVTAPATALAWAGLSAYTLHVQRKREAMALLRDRARGTLDDMAQASPDERYTAARSLFRDASREAVMRCAAERDVPTHTFDALTALLDERWSTESLAADAEHHRTGREKWRRITALRILERLTHPSALRLLARAASDSDADVAEAAIALLAHSSEPPAADCLVDALVQQRIPASRVAIYIDQSPADLSSRLVSLLAHEQPSVRQWATTLLTRYETRAHETHLLALTRDTDGSVRKAAVQALAAVGTDDAVDRLVELLADPVPFVRAHAARALAELGCTDCAAAVTPLLGDADFWVRLAARESLEEMGSEVWPVLVRCLDHPDQFVRNGAAEVVQNLGVLDSLIMLEAASDYPSRSKLDMLKKITDAGGVRFTDSLVERAGPEVGPKVRRLLDSIGLEYVKAA